MNGALSRKQYQHMIMNADTFMVVISALQTLGNNPVAPGVALHGASLTVTPAATGAPGQAGTGAATASFQPNALTQLPSAKDKSAEMAAQIVSAYLQYRMILSRELARSELQQKSQRPKQRMKSY